MYYYLFVSSRAATALARLWGRRQGYGNRGPPGRRVRAGRTRSALILGGFPHVVYDEHLDWSFCGQQSEAELFLDKGEERGAVGL
jgi:hypothetical protein